MNAIEHIVESDRLFLSWQSVEDNRERFVVGELCRKPNGGATFQYYCTSSNDFRRACSLGFRGYPAFRTARKSNFQCNAVEAFMRRLPPKHRGDYAKYLSFHGLYPDHEISDFALLGYLKCKLPGDGFEIVDLFESATEGAPFEFIIEVAGFRHNGVLIDDISDSCVVKFVPEPDNPFDSRAIAIYCSYSKVGYIDRARTEIFHRLFKQRDVVRARVHTRNGTNKRPLLYLFVEVNPPEAGDGGPTPAAAL